jgi:hypothetical protein
MVNVLIKVVEKIKTHILCSITFFPENYVIYDITSTIWRSQEATDNKIRRLHLAFWLSKATRMQVNEHALTHSITICNTYCFPTTTLAS